VHCRYWRICIDPNTDASGPAEIDLALDQPATPGRSHLLAIPATKRWVVYRHFYWILCPCVSRTDEERPAWKSSGKIWKT
jgi:hypothetical protein